MTVRSRIWDGCARVGPTVCHSHVNESRREIESSAHHFFFIFRIIGFVEPVHTRATVYMYMRCDDAGTNERTRLPSESVWLPPDGLRGFRQAAGGTWGSRSISGMVF